MASTIAAVTTGGGGVITTADASGNLSLLSGATTIVAVTSAGVAVTGTLSSSGASTFTGTGKFATTIGVGNATPSASGSGITFPATQSASSDANTLDDYEEGTWTPTIMGIGGVSGQAYSSQTGVYRKIGGFVYANFDVTLSAKGTITSIASIGGFPFLVSGQDANAIASIAYWASMATTWVYIAGHFPNSTTSAVLYGATTASATLSSLATADIANNTRFMGMAVYPSA